LFHPGVSLGAYDVPRIGSLSPGTKGTADVGAFVTFDVFLDFLVFTFDDFDFFFPAVLVDLEYVTTGKVLDGELDFREDHDFVILSVVGLVSFGSVLTVLLLVGFEDITG
jgi:hypothetical protein